MKAMLGYTRGQCIVGEAKVYSGKDGKEPSLKVQVSGPDVKSTSPNWLFRAAFWVRGQGNIERFQKTFPKGTVIEGSWAPVKADWKDESGEWHNAIELDLDASEPFVVVPQEPVAATSAKQVPF